MRDIFLRKLRSYAAVRTHLNRPEHKPLWFNVKPRQFTTLEAQFETEAADLGAFGDSQSQPLTGITAGQNLAEKELEDTAHPLSRALRRQKLAVGDAAAAAVWNLTLTDWRRLQEAALLDKARALLAALLPLTTGTPPPGEVYGITTEETDELSDLIDDYADVLGQPIAARSARKAKTTALRPRFRSVDGILEAMDDFILRFRDNGGPGSLFVDGYFNARRLGGNPAEEEDEEEGDGDENNGAPTPPPGG